MTRKRKEPAAYVPPVVLRRETTVEIGGQVINSGDLVKVRNPEGSSEKYMRGTWSFRAFVTNEAGTSWCDIHGGKANREMLRAFPADRIEPVKKRTTTRRNK